MRLSDTKLPKLKKYSEPSYRTRIYIDRDGHTMTVEDPRNRDMLHRIIKNVDEVPVPVIPGFTVNALVVGIAAGMWTMATIAIYMFFRYH